MMMLMTLTLKRSDHNSFRREMANTILESSGMLHLESDMEDERSKQIDTRL